MKKLNIYEYYKNHGPYKNHTIYRQRLVDVVRSCDKLPSKCSIILSDGKEYHCPDSSLYDADDKTYEEMMIILEKGGFDTNPQKQKSSLVGIEEEFSSLIDESFSIQTASKHLGVSEDTIQQRLIERTLYGFKIDLDWRLPRFQFTNNGEVNGISQVIEVLPTDLHPVEISKWFNIPNPDLYIDEKTEQPITPLDWLYHGCDPKNIIELAKYL